VGAGADAKTKPPPPQAKAARRLSRTIFVQKICSVKSRDEEWFR
jgi:hypothetical protein